MPDSRNHEVRPDFRALFVAIEDAAALTGLTDERLRQLARTKQVRYRGSLNDPLFSLSSLLALPPPGAIAECRPGSLTIGLRFPSTWTLTSDPGPGLPHVDTHRQVGRGQRRGFGHLDAEAHVPVAIRALGRRGRDEAVIEAAQTAPEILRLKEDKPGVQVIAAEPHPGEPHRFLRPGEPQL